MKKHLGDVGMIAGMVLAWSIYYAVSKRMVSATGSPFAAGFLLRAAALVFLFDKKAQTNYMFLNWPPAGSPLAWIASYLGNPGYLAGYAVLVILVPVGMAAAYQLFSRKPD